MKILIKALAKSQWEVRLDHKAITFRSEAEARAFAETCKRAPRRRTLSRSASNAPPLAETVRQPCACKALARCRRKVDMATVTANNPHKLMTIAIGKAVPSCNTPTSDAAPAATPN
jgi:hypothetical protein